MMKLFLPKTLLTVFVLLLIGCEQPVAPGSDISQQELTARLSSNDAPLILDVRSADEFTAGHLPGAVNIPHTEVGERIGELNLDKSDEIVIHCYSGKRAGIATGVPKFPAKATKMTRSRQSFPRFY